MEIYKLVGITIISICIIIFLKENKRDEFALIVTIISSIILFTYILLKLEDIINILNDLTNKAGINSSYLKILLKVVGISYIVEIAKNICLDSGNSSLGAKIEMAGKVGMVALTIPIISNIVSMVIDIL